MKNIITISVLLVVIHLFYGCSKGSSNSTPELTITTLSATNITDSTASAGGNITSTGTVTVTARGVCWSTNQNPTITDVKTVDGTGTGQFVSNLTGLTDNTLYYVRAYSTSSSGTTYGNEISFTTSVKQASNEVTIQNYAFSPQTLTVQVNWMVKWTNKDNMGHTVTSDTGLFDSGTLDLNGTFSYLFTTPGTYTYHCKIHTYMTGTIIVQ